MAADRALRILGLDPGSRATGFGVVEKAARGKKPILVAAGVIRPPQKADLPLRLKAIHQGVMAVIEEHRPQEAAVESVFTAKNPKSAIILGQARGVALLAASLSGLDVFEYAPTEVKKALVGVGRAAKEQVRVMTSALLGANRRTFGAKPLPLDASDALAVALTHLNSRNLKLKGL